MSELATVARPYAVAVFKRAKETNTVKQWADSLSFLTGVIDNPSMNGVIDNPKIGKKDLLTLLLDVCQGQLHSECENFIHLLIHNNKLALISTITRLFESYKAEDEGYIDVDVVTAFDFSEEAKAQFTVTLEKTLGKKVNMNVTVDSSLIGGVLVRAGDRVIDGSVRGRLQQLAKKL